MNNLIIISNDIIDIKAYLQDYYQNNKIKKNHIIEIKSESNQISIEQIREIMSLAYRKYAHPTAFIIWSFGSCRELVQNVFLKNLEEHQANIYFILITHSLAPILPTIASRCEIIHLKTKKLKLSSENKEQIENMLNLFQENSTFIASEKLSLSPKTKKTKVLDWLNDFFIYGYDMLPQSNKKTRLANLLTKALEAKQLIENNNFDPELALNNIFL